MNDYVFIDVEAVGLVEKSQMKDTRFGVHQAGKLTYLNVFFLEQRVMETFKGFFFSNLSLILCL